MKLDCIHFKQGCSGCTRMDANSFEFAVSYFKEKFNYALTISKGDETHWRTRAKLAVRGLEPKLGLYKAGTHDVLSIPLCQVQTEELNLAAALIKKWMIDEHLTSYNESSGQGQIRYIQLTLERKTAKVQVVLVVNENLTDSSVKRLFDSNLVLFHSVWVNVNTSRQNVIWGQDWYLKKGEIWLEESFLGKSYFFHPASFMQANPDQYEKLLFDMSNNLLPQKRIVEFYAGGGTIGLSLLDLASKVTMTELNKNGQACFEENIKRLRICDRAKVSYFAIDAKEGSSYLLDHDIVILDPPRKGVDSTLLSKIVESNIQQVIYVSCGWPAFMRDAEYLKTQGFKLTFARGYLFFPGTDHLETLAVFNR